MKQFSFFLFIIWSPLMLLSQPIEWLRTFTLDTMFNVPIGLYELGTDIIPTSDSGFLSIGVEVYPNALNFRYVRAIKVNADGEDEWTKVYRYHPDENFAEFAWDEAYSVLETKDGNFLIAGSQFGAGDTLVQAMLMKIGPNGDSIWRKKYPIPGESKAFVVEEKHSDNYILGGQTRYEGEEHTFITKIYIDGDSSWTRLYFPGIESKVYDLEMIEDFPFGYVGTGVVDGNLKLFELNYVGGIVWEQTFDFSNRDAGFSIRIDDDGGFIISGTTEENGIPVPLILKTDREGNEIWHTTLDIDWALGSTVRPFENGYVLSGSVVDIFGGFGSQYGFLAKLDKDGNLLKSYILEELEEMEAGGHNVLSDGSIVMTGTSSAGLFILKTSEITDTKLIEVQEEFVSIFPQPAYEAVTFQWMKSPNRIWTVELWNGFGQLISTQNSQEQSLTLQQYDLPNGWYVYRIKCGNRLQTGKLLFH